jgi:TDG/mug DNA glycosylase family protein
MLPVELAGVHRAMAVGDVLELTLPGGWTGPPSPPDLLVGAGFTVDDIATRDGRVVAHATRARTLPDTVGPGMRRLICGLNPSLYAADVGVGFARPGNRFWPAALAAGIASTDRSPYRALADHGTGMTDLVKRATVGAAELTAAEYRAGLARVERLVAWLRPALVCFVGLAGWRAAVDRRAVAGVQPAGLAGTPVYVMPSTSGLNARVPLAELTDHLRAATDLSER